MGNPADLESRVNGHKPKVFVLQSDNTELNHALQVTFRMHGYEPCVVNGGDAASDAAIAKEIDEHDLFLLCGGEGFRDNPLDPANLLLPQVMRAKNKASKPYMAIVQFPEGPEGVTYRIFGLEGVSPTHLSKGLEVAKRAFKVYRSFQGHPIDITPDILDGISAIVRRSESERYSLETLEAQIRQNPRDPKLYFACGKEFETRGQLGMAYANYRKALLLKPDYAEALEAFGELLLEPRMIDWLEKEHKTREALSVLNAVSSETISSDKFKIPLYLALGDDDSLRQAVAICENNRSSNDFGNFFAPVMIDAYARIAHRSQDEADAEKLFEIIDSVVKGMRGITYSTEGASAVGLRLVKIRSGRHTVYDVVPMSSEGIYQSQYVFVKSYPSDERNAAEREHKIIGLLNKKHRKGGIVAPYESLHIPSFTMLAKKRGDERGPAYLLNPLLEGRRADRLLESVSKSANERKDEKALKEAREIKLAFLKRIMDGGLALQLALDEVCSEQDKESYPYVERFEKKGLGRLENYGVLKLKRAERDTAIAFFRSVIDEPLTDVDPKLSLPYTGSHTLKNILIASPSAIRSIEDVARSVIKRCDIEDWRRRFFAADHVLAVEDSAIAIDDARTLSGLYDRLIVRRLTADRNEALDGLAPSTLAKRARKFLQSNDVKCTYPEYHRLIRRASLERHLTYAFDRIKEIQVVEADRLKLEAENPRFKAYGEILLAYLRQQAEHSPVDYNALLNKIIETGVSSASARAQKHKILHYISLHKDYEVFQRSKEHHLAWARRRLDELRSEEGKNGAGYRVMCKIIESMRAYDPAKVHKSA